MDPEVEKMWCDLLGWSICGPMLIGIVLYVIAYIIFILRNIIMMIHEALYYIIFSRGEIKNDPKGFVKYLWRILIGKVF